MLPTSLSTVLSAFPELPAPEVVPITSGLSQTAVWRVTARSEHFCLRCWPREHPGPDRLRWMQQVLTTARSNGCPFVPQTISSRSGAPFLALADGLWELQTWMPGEPAELPPPALKVRNAFQALAQFHEATQPLGRESGPPPAVCERRDRLRALLSGEGAALVARAASGGDHPLAASLAQGADNLLRGRGPAWLAELERLSQIPVRLQPAIRDVRPEHLLFVGDEVTGLIDYGAMRFDTRLTDLARLLDGYCGELPELRQNALQSYVERSPLSVQEMAWVDQIDRAGVLISAFQWLRWLLLEKRNFARSRGGERRMAEIANRLSQMAAQPGPIG